MQTVIIFAASVILAAVNLAAFVKDRRPYNAGLALALTLMSIMLGTQVAIVRANETIKKDSAPAEKSVPVEAKPN